MSVDSVGFETVAKQFASDPRVAEGKWFGKTCLKVDGKAFAVLWGGDLAFKLAAEVLGQALQIEGAHLFDPRGSGTPFREWVRIPRQHASEWPRFAELACLFVATTGG